MKLVIRPPILGTPTLGTLICLMSWRNPAIAQGLGLRAMCE